MFTKNTFVAALCLLSCTAYALPSPSQIYRAENNQPGGVVTADVLAARTAFIAALDNSAQSFGFERLDLIPGTPSPISTTFTGSAGSSITATLAGGALQRVMGESEAGRFNTTSSGSKYWRVNSTSGAGNFSITFDRGVSAFGFYGTDIGDFGGVLSLVLTPFGGGPDETLIVRPQSAQSAGSGALLFYGFADTNSVYRMITFVSSGTSTAEDYYGFDDFVVADRGQIRVPTPPTGMPEPGSLALAGLALLAAASAGWARKARETT